MHAYLDLSHNASFWARKTEIHECAIHEWTCSVNSNRWRKTEGGVVCLEPRTPFLLGNSAWFDFAPLITSQLPYTLLSLSRLFPVPPSFFPSLVLCVLCFLFVRLGLSLMFLQERTPCPKRCALGGVGMLFNHRSAFPPLNHFATCTQ